jgi:hypothetical protein
MDVSAFPFNKGKIKFDVIALKKIHIDSTLAIEMRIMVQQLIQLQQMLVTSYADKSVGTWMEPKSRVVLKFGML